jgi:ABC-2 type transport system permease protein
MLVAAIRKEALLLVADRGALASMFLLPLAFIAFFGLAFRGGEGAAARPLAVWLDPGDARGAAVVQALADSGLFAPELATTAAEVRRRVAAEEVRVGLVVPADFAPLAGRPAELVIDEGAPMQLRGPIEAALQALITRATASPALAAELAAPVVRASAPPGLRRPLGELDSFQIAVPGNALLFGFFLAVSVGLSFVEERRIGTWRRLTAAPVRPWMPVIAKLVPYYLIGLGQMSLLFGIGVLAFGMRVGGSPIALVAITLVVVFSATALGLLVASFGGSEKQVGGFASLSVLVMALLGGAILPRPMMPDWVQRLGLLVPHGWALDAYYDVLVRDGTTLTDVARPLVALAGFGLAFAGIGVARFRRAD